MDTAHLIVFSATRIKARSLLSYSCSLFSFHPLSHAGSLALWTWQTRLDPGTLGGTRPPSLNTTLSDGCVISFKAPFCSFQSLSSGLSILTCKQKSGHFFNPPPHISTLSASRGGRQVCSQGAASSISRVLSSTRQGPGEAGPDTMTPGILGLYLQRSSPRLDPGKCDPMYDRILPWGPLEIQKT